MEFIDALGVVLLGATFVVQLFYPALLARWVRLVWRLGFAAVFGLVGYLGWVQYETWRGSSFGKLLLPPYQPATYFILYILSRLLGPWLIAFFAAFLVSRSAKILNSRFGERFFEHEEITLIALGVFLTGYPSFLWYLGSVLLGGMVLSVAYSLAERGRAPLYYLWLPLAILVIILKGFFPQSIFNFFAL